MVTVKSTVESIPGTGNRRFDIIYDLTRISTVQDNLEREGLTMAGQPKAARDPEDYPQEGEGWDLSMEDNPPTDQSTSSNDETHND
jgi:hypothetical protein